MAGPEEQAAELYRRHRPQGFGEMVGQAEAIKVLNEMGRRGEIPHALMLTGPSGCGKTTLARILRMKLKCGDHDYVEVNGSDARGIDDIRAIRAQMSMAPMGGKTRVWVIDECFPAGTPIFTPGGDVDIEKVEPGDSICSLEGVTTVRALLKNKVDLRRLVRVFYSDGSSQITTRDHLFLTDTGWMRAGDLHRCCVVRDSRYPVSTSIKEIGDGAIEYDSSVRMVRDGLSKPRTVTAMLFEELWSEVEEQEGKQRRERGAGVRGVRKALLCNQGASAPEEVLRKVVSRSIQKSTARVQKQVVLSGGGAEDFAVAPRVCSDFRRAGSGEEGFSENEGEESFPTSFGYREGSGDEEDSRHRRVERGSRGQRSVDSSPGESLAGPSAPFNLGLGYGDSHSDQGKTNVRGRYSDQLQGRYRLYADSIGSGSRRQWASIEKEYVARHKEEVGAGILRVDRVEVYQPGDSRGLFRGCVSDLDVRRGYVEFYDLQVDGHPSYVAGGVVVHNCHALTSDAQSAFLKMLEDTPAHVYFILCTTDPQKLKPTIHTRCTKIECKPIGEQALRELVVQVAEKEGVDLEPPVAVKIAQSADGSARKALVLLHSVIRISGAEAQLAAIEGGATEASANLAKLLMNSKSSWKDFQQALTALEDDPEQTRRGILGYAQSALLKGWGSASQAALILEEFREPFYNTGKPGLTLACYRVAVGFK